MGTIFDLFFPEVCLVTGLVDVWKINGVYII